MQESPRAKLTVLQLVKKFPIFYGPTKVHYAIHKSTEFVRVLCQIIPVHTSILLKIHLNIIP
jgi:hypothetical protein